MESPAELWREFDKLQWWMGYCLRWHQSKPRKECRCWRPQKHFHQPIHQFDFRPRDGTSIICFDFDYRNLKGVFLAAFIRESNNFPLLIFLDAERSRGGRNGSYIIVFIRHYLLGLIPFCSFIPHAEYKGIPAITYCCSTTHTPHIIFNRRGSWWPQDDYLGDVVSSVQDPILWRRGKVDMELQQRDATRLDLTARSKSFRGGEMIPLCRHFK